MQRGSRSPRRGRSSRTPRPGAVTRSAHRQMSGPSRLVKPMRAPRSQMFARRSAPRTLRRFRRGTRALGRATRQWALSALPRAPSRTRAVRRHRVHITMRRRRTAERVRRSRSRGRLRRAGSCGRGEHYVCRKRYRSGAFVRAMRSVARRPLRARYRARDIARIRAWLTRTVRVHRETALARRRRSRVAASRAR